MKFGYLTLNSADGIHPGELARELESRGFDSLWVPEHSHIPVASAGSFPDPTRALPDGYAHMMSPFISLMAAAATTSTLQLGTGMAVGLEHDLMDLACTTATLDVLSNGRLILGMGVGWNQEEFDNHRPAAPFRKRYSAMKDRVAALRAAWGTDNALPAYDGLYGDTDWGRQISAYEGEFEGFTPSWVFPKPPRGAVPVALGYAGPLGMQHAAEIADIWAPVDKALMRDGKPDVAGGLADFRALVEKAGRDPGDVSVILFNLGGETEAMIEQYVELGIEHFVFGPVSFMRHPAAETLRRLDALQPYVDNHGNR